MKIKNILVNGDIIEVKPYIFVVTIKDNYDRSMLFCRYQEYYESSFPEIRGCSFSLEEYMKIYSKNNKENIFTYPHDLVGFHLPSNKILESKEKFKSTLNGYDLVMNDIIDFCEKESKFRNYDTAHPWFLIGVESLKSPMFNHEIAHALYHINLNYKVEMDYHTFKIPKKELTILKNGLIKSGYVNDDTILSDELQSYMSTGKLHLWSDVYYQKYSQNYIETFKKFNI
jgi:hypothetical protein